MRGREGHSHHWGLPDRQGLPALLLALCSVHFHMPGLLVDGRTQASCGQGALAQAGEGQACAVSWGVVSIVREAQACIGSHTEQPLPLPLPRLVWSLEPRAGRSESALLTSRCGREMDGGSLIWAFSMMKSGSR